MSDRPNKHVYEALGMSRVTIIDGKVVDVSDPQLKYCPLFNKYRNITTIDKQAVKENFEFRIKDFGMCTENRIVRNGDYISFGVSEILSKAIEDGVIEGAVIAADGCGTAVVKEAAVVQGLCGRISGLVETSPLNVVLDAVGRDYVLDPETTPIDQVKGAELAASKGMKRFAVTVAIADDAETIRKKFGSDVIIVAVHTSMVKRCDAEKFFEYCDFITSCASGHIRDIADSRSDIVIAGNKVPMVGVTEIGKELILNKLVAIGKKPWTGTPERDDPAPML